MNVNPILLAMSDTVKLPVKQDVYSGAEQSYIIFNYADERESFHADNMVKAETAYMQIHLFVPANVNYIKTKQIIKSYLRKNDFINISVQSLYEKDTEKRHIIFECEITLRMEE